MIETRDGKVKSIAGFHNKGLGTAFTKAEAPLSGGHTDRQAAGSTVGSASEMLKKRYEHIVLKQPERGYSFKCSGEYKGKMDVEWSAKYSKPLEYIMFPSLSLANNNGEVQLSTVREKFAHPSNTSLATFDKFATEEGHGTAVDADINWKVKVREKANVTVKKTTLLQEIETMGEAVLRSKLVENYNKQMAKLSENDGEKTEDELLGIRKKIWRIGASSLKEMLQPTPDDLYTQLRKASKAEKGNQLVRAAAQNRRSASAVLTDGSFMNQKAYLNAAMGEDCAHLVEGVLYYRMKNEMTIVDRTEKNLDIKSTPIHLATTTPKRRRTQLLNKIELRQANLLQNPQLASHFQAVAAAGRLNEALEFAESDVDHQLTEHIRSQSPVDMSRVRQAITARNYGYDSELNNTAFGGDHEHDHGSRPNSRQHHNHNNHRNNHHHHHHRNVNLEKLKRDAQDELLMKSLELGIIPEDFLMRCSRNTSYFDIDLADYGIGDERGLCLGPCLDKLTNISTLGLRGNRLTKLSIPTILKCVPYRHLLNLDLSRNNLHRCAEDLMQFFMKEPILQVLDLSYCELACQDIVTIFSPLLQVNSNLQDLDLGNNKIELMGVNLISNILEKSFCTIESLSLAWNNVGSEGANMISSALAVNSSLHHLNLSCTNIDDLGGQQIAFSLGANTTLQTMILSQNSIKDSSCFVFSMTLPKHPAMRALDLCSNPLGEIGARSLFRTILNESAKGGFRPLISMRMCTYAIDDSIFNHSYPEMDSPYTLDMSKPYDTAILMELLAMTVLEPGICKCDSITLRETPNGPETSLGVIVNPQSNKLVYKSTGALFVPPSAGIIKLHFSKTTAMPTMDKKISTEALNVLEKIILFASTDSDRRKFLECMWTDMYCTTQQAQGMIDRFQSKEMKKIISPGGLSVQDVIICLWSNILDAENKFDFFCYNIQPQSRKDFIYQLTFPKFKFNWVNPTSFWRLDLANRAQRVVMMSIICINHIESEFSKQKSGRSDTSQKSNWHNFRNERYGPPGEPLQEIEFDSQFLARLPTQGIVEFDYVSTTRPIIPYKAPESANAQNHQSQHHQQQHHSQQQHQPRRGNSATAGTSNNSNNSNHASASGSGMGDLFLENDVVVDGSLYLSNEDSLMSLSMDDLSIGEMSNTSSYSSNSIIANPNTANGTANNHQQLPYTNDDSSSPFYGRPLNDEEFDNFMKQLELDRGIRLSKSSSIYKLLELQIAASKYYFTVQRVLKILDVFSDDRSTQAKVVVCMFSRIIDLYNFDAIMRHLEQPVREEVLSSIGNLNCFNALKPGGDYIISLKHRDCRLLVLMLLSIAECEKNPLNKDKYSDMSMVDVYQHKSRLLDTTSLQGLVLRFTYSDYSEMQATPKEREDINWDFRRNNINATLLGTKPLDRNQFRIISMYKEMEAAGTLSAGPIETQYLNHIKQRGHRKLPTSANGINSANSQPLNGATK